MRQRITNILEGWFLKEPAMFQVVCAHEIVENSQMECPVRSGKMRLEYNPDFLENMSDETLEEAIKTEAIRILMKHPYQRKPEQCSSQAIAVGSNITISDNYDYNSLNIESPSDYGLDKGKSYEFYSWKIQQMLPPGDEDSDGQGDGSGMGDLSPAQRKLNSRKQQAQDLSALWDEDDLSIGVINGIIDSVKSWGSLSGSFAEKLKASTKSRINWRQMLRGFRASILSSRTKLTRMRPNRRTEFLNMGQVREYDTKLLVAVDVSGSISSDTLAYFYGTINSCFKYGITSVDVCQFDCGVKVVHSLKKVIRDVAVVGRGGTSFQEPIDYAIENGYDGLVILTDGYAPSPDIPDKCRLKILWVCENASAYEKHHNWMEKIGRVCTMEVGE